MNMIFSLYGRKRGKALFNTLYCIIWWINYLPLHLLFEDISSEPRILLSRKFVFSIICMLNCCLSSENAQKRCRIRCIQSSLIFFLQFRPFDYSFLQCSCLAGLQFPVWSCMAIYISFIWITCLPYYSWSLISATWMWMQSCLTKGFHHFLLVILPHLMRMWRCSIILSNGYCSGDTSRICLCRNIGIKHNSNLINTAA